MKYSFSIISKLYSLSILWFIISCFVLVYNLVCIFFPSKDFIIRNGNSSVWGGSNVYREGYPIPVQLNIQMPADTLVNYKKGSMNGSINLNKNDFFRYYKTDSILNDTSIKKTLYFSHWIAVPPFNEMSDSDGTMGKDEFDIFQKEIQNSYKYLSISANRSYSTTTTINVRSKSKLKNFFLSLNVLLGILISIVLSYYFMRILKDFYKKISFTKVNYKRFYLIGFIIILGQIGKLILSFIYSKWYGGARLIKATDIEYLKGTEFNVSINPTFDFEINTILFGLAIIVLSYIFKYGNKLEEENALTV
jgi:hypothetical protein